jgi:hypothetical protein
VARWAISIQARAIRSAPSIGCRKVTARPPPSAVAVASRSSRAISALMSLASHAALNALMTRAWLAAGAAGAMGDLEDADRRPAPPAPAAARGSGIDEDLNASGRYASIRAHGWALDRDRDADEIRRLLGSPDVAVGSVNAVTEAGALVIASASGSQLPGYAGGAAQAIWVVGAQKVVPDLDAALRRIEDYVLPLESARVQVVYGGPSAVNRVLILNAEPHPGRGTVLLLRQAIGF